MDVVVICNGISWIASRGLRSEGFGRVHRCKGRTKEFASLGRRDGSNGGFNKVFDIAFLIILVKNNRFDRRGRT
jgi:hypothetical protein